MTERELLAELDRLFSIATPTRDTGEEIDALLVYHADTLIAALRRSVSPRKPHPGYTLSQWHEDLGDVLCWTLPVEEAPYVGMPLASDWPFGEDDGTRRMVLRWTPLPSPPRDPAA